MLCVVLCVVCGAWRVVCGLWFGVCVALLQPPTHPPPRSFLSLSLISTRSQLCQCSFGECVPKYHTMRGGMCLKVPCSKNFGVCAQCECKYIVLHNKATHDHLKEEKGRVITTTCIAPGHFVACVTGKIVPLSERHVKSAFDVEYTDGKRYYVSPMLDKACEETKAVMRLKGSTNELTACGLLKYSDHPNASVDKYGYVWATTHIKRGEAILIDRDLTTMILSFKKHRKQLAKVPMRAFLEPFGEMKEGEENKSVLQYLVDNEAIYSYKILSKYLPQVVKSDEYLELTNGDGSDLDIMDPTSQPTDMELEIDED